MARVENITLDSQGFLPSWHTKIGFIEHSTEFLVTNRGHLVFIKTVAYMPNVLLHSLLTPRVHYMPPCHEELTHLTTGKVLR